MSGICFVGSVNNAYRGGFVLVPVAIVVIFGLFFLVKGTYKNMQTFQIIFRLNLIIIV